MPRERLPDRRQAETLDLWHGGRRYNLTIGKYPNGSPGEASIRCATPGSDIVVPFGNDAHGHVWLHHQCWKPWMQKRREDAISALATTGIRVHEKTTACP